ncbi:peptidylprolyl isomerase [Paenibacillus doosanensis]|uniref:peptidylprolyl isomerase n=1 Tax=Paenibacillus doosanensis TaxID=1229154 RepID=UPI00217F4517|nr:peptidylprolyl isomerase [Paenibacillus doosanensis]MCS7459729.1 peptidylprolyl isomerase [Paenibacillus doosanensis]
MNDKLKGLVLGLSLGVMLTGSVAYASGTQIEVYFQNLKYMFDGFEKKPAEDQGQGFIYNGTTYVPLRFVSEALGKDVQWDDETQTIWVGKKLDTAATVAEYQGGQVTRGDYEKFAAVMRFLNPQNAQHEQDNQYKQYIIDQIAASHIIAGKLDEETAAKLPALVDGQMRQLEQLNSSSAQTLSEQLKQQGLSEDDLKTFVRDTVTLQTWSTNAVDDATVKAEYDKKAASGDESVITASVRHILVMNEDDKGSKLPKETVDAKLKEIQDKLAAGADFAELAKQYSEDPGSKDNGGLYANVPVSQWTENFKKATMTLELNKISDPIETEYGYHIIRVESRGVIPYDELKETLKQSLSQTKYNDFMTKELPGLITNVELPQ